MTATLLPVPLLQLIDANGNPYAGGVLATYIPNTTTLSTTWQDQAQTTPNANPLTLDASGRCQIWGVGSYRVILHDALGSLVFDQVASCAPAVSAGMVAFLALSGPAAALSWLGAAPGFATLAALRGNSATGFAVASVGGYAAANDGGGGLFALVGSDTTSSDNGGTIVVDAAGQRWYREIGEHFYSVKWFGAAGNGTTNDATAVNNTIAAAVAASRPVYFPAGTYLLNSAQTVSLSGSQSVTIFGDGVAATCLYWPNSAGGFALTFNSSANCLSVRDLTFATGQAGTTNAITVTGTVAILEVYRNYIKNTDFRGYDQVAGAYGNNYWAVCVSVNDAFGFDLESVNFQGPGVASPSHPAGTGFFSQASSAALQASQMSFCMCSFYNLLKAVDLGAWTQGLVFSVCYMENCTDGIYIESGAGQLYLAIENCFIQCNSGNGIFIGAGATMTDILITGNDIYISNPGFTGLTCSSTTAYRFMITGNNFTGEDAANTAGIAINNNGTGSVGTIVGNVFTNLTWGVTLAAGSSGWNVQANAYYGNTTNVVDAAGSANTIGGGSS